jgi:DNA-binding MarR family transcriptional regulator
MDYVQAQIKRAHLRMVAFGRRAFAPKVEKDGRVVDEGVPDMTPARFDLMYAVHGHSSHHIFRTGIPQEDLEETLGLHKTTVSKMLTRLEELGLVYRVRSGGRDKRKKFVLLTKEGRRRIRAAFDVVFNKGVVRRKLQLLFTRANRDLAQVRIQVFNIFVTARMVAEHFGATTKALYVTAFPEYDD